MIWCERQEIQEEGQGGVGGHDGGGDQERHQADRDAEDEGGGAEPSEDA